MKENIYVHTIDGRPAEYWPDEKIIYFARKKMTRFADSLQQIKREREKSDHNRTRKGFPSWGTAGYFIIPVSALLKDGKQMKFMTRLNKTLWPDIIGLVMGVLVMYWVLK